MTSSMNDPQWEQKMKEARPEELHVPDFDQWAKAHAEDLVALQACGRNPSTSSPTLWRCLQVAAAVLILLGIGFLSGRISISRQTDQQQLYADLETSLRTSLQGALKQEIVNPLNDQWQGALQASCAQLRTEILAQLNRDLGTLTENTLALTERMTDQRLAELVRLIETARLQDRRQIAAALEQIELGRLRDKIQIDNGFQTLVAYTAKDESTDLN